ncbi:uncharacterized protein V6R79_000070 [Siganus canaliculatus]
MEQTLTVLVAAVIVCLAPGIQGTSHLSFANNTEVNITRDGCGSTKLCLETPTDCDPAGNSSCLFASLMASTPMAPNGTELMVELRGDSMGYIALGLTANASEGATMLFICAQDNGTFFFRTMDKNNTDMTLMGNERRVTEIRGVVNDNVIHCEFNIPAVNATASRTTESTTFTVLLGTGPTTGNMTGAFSANLTEVDVNVADPASTATTTMAPTTIMANATTMSGSGAVQPQILLLLLSIVTLSAMLRA